MKVYFIDDDFYVSRNCRYSDRTISLIEVEVEKETTMQYRLKPDTHNCIYSNESRSIGLAGPSKQYVFKDHWSTFVNKDQATSKLRHMLERHYATLKIQCDRTFTALADLTSASSD